MRPSPRPRRPRARQQDTSLMPSKPLRPDHRGSTCSPSHCGLATLLLALASPEPREGRDRHQLPTQHAQTSELPLCAQMTHRIFMCSASTFSRTGTRSTMRRHHPASTTSTRPRRKRSHAEKANRATSLTSSTAEVLMGPAIHPPPLSWGGKKGTADRRVQLYLCRVFTTVQWLKSMRDGDP